MAALILIAQLSPVDQVRFAALLNERLQQAFHPEPAPTPTDEPAFWHTPIEDDPSRTTDALRGSATQALVRRWFTTALASVGVESNTDGAIAQGLSPSFALGCEGWGGCLTKR